MTYCNMNLPCEPKRYIHTGAATYKLAQCILMAEIDTMYRNSNAVVPVMIPSSLVSKVHWPEKFK